MNKIIKTALGAAILLSLGTTTASADIDRGQKLVVKKLKKACDMSVAALAGKHTQGEWGDIQAAGNLATEIKEICPNVKSGSIKEKYMIHYSDFFIEYASDSGNVPAC